MWIFDCYSEFYQKEIDTLQENERLKEMMKKEKQSLKWANCNALWNYNHPSHYTHGVYKNKLFLYDVGWCNYYQAKIYCIWTGCDTTVIYTQCICSSFLLHNLNCSLE